MCCIFFFFKQKTAYEMRISDWSSDVCSSDLVPLLVYPAPEAHGPPLPEGSGDNAQARLHPAGDDVHHLRTYRRGDPRRAIAWKPSARHGALLVREYEPRPDERRVGNECVRTCRSRWPPQPSKKTTTNTKPPQT